MADYISRTYYGDVIRRADNVVVAPTGDDQNPDFLAWAEWCAAGNEPDIDDTMPPVTVEVPPSLTPWQVRKGLNLRGLRETVEAIVAQQDQDTRDGWEFATEFLLDDPLLNAMAPIIGIDLPEFFVFASGL